MHIQTHVMSGWIAANFFQLTPRERLFGMLAAALADCDGLGILVSEKLYLDYHHIAGHNLWTGIIIASLLTIWSTHRLKTWWLYLGLFHLHLGLDLLGSGELWTIAYFWPVTHHELYFEYCWPLYSWQNILAGIIALSAVIAIAIGKKRTPLEAIMPRLDRQLVELLCRFYGRIRRHNS